MSSSGVVQTPLSSSKPVPICAEGELKVSGWKRNNLLAKTLGHLDEIRGNQRPIFVPMKITLATTNDASQANSSGGSNSTRRSSSAGNKFADIVREAINKKSLLSQAQPKPSVEADTLQQQQQQQQTNSNQIPEVARTSLSQGRNHSHEHVHNAADVVGLVVPTTSQLGTSAAQRSVSADGGVSADAAASAARSSLSVMSSAPSSTQQRRSQQINQMPLVSGTNRPSLQQQNYVAHLLSAMADSSSSAPASSRELKLQLKNEQVMQNLRRQSNELSRAELHADLEGSGAASGTNMASGELEARSSNESQHLKDWKRLTSRLLSGRGSNARPLRLTLSNQEQSSRAAGTSGPSATAMAAMANSLQTPSLQRSGISAQHLSALGLGDRLLVEGQRKLSSSSMVVQPSSAATGSGSQQPHNLLPGSSQCNQRDGRLQNARSAASSPMRPSLGVGGGVVKQQQQPSAARSGTTASPGASGQPSALQIRRSSDSEAYGSAIMQAARSRHTSQENSPEVAASTPFKQPQLQPSSCVIVVNQDDLMQLLQVKSSTALTDATQPLAASDRSSATSADSNASSGRSDAAPANQSPAAEPTAATSVHRNPPPSPQTQSSAADSLSKLVKRTSRVAGFHRKLRAKIRWRRSSANARPTADSTRATDAPAPCSPPASLSGGEIGAQCAAHEGAASSSGVDPAAAIDPMLIGDAIEIFLRSTMQRNGSTSEHDDDDGDANDIEQGQNNDVAKQATTTTVAKVGAAGSDTVDTEVEAAARLSGNERLGCCSGGKEEEDPSEGNKSDASTAPIQPARNG